MTITNNDEVINILESLIDKTQIKITVWTNGKAIRKYTGQDTVQTNDPNHGYKHPKDKGWYKATAIIIKEV